jgi:hypothetical protein
MSDKVRMLKIVSNYVIKKEVPKSTVSIKRVLVPVVIERSNLHSEGVRETE